MKSRIYDLKKESGKKKKMVYCNSQKNFINIFGMTLGNINGRLGRNFSIFLSAETHHYHYSCLSRRND